MTRQLRSGLVLALLTVTVSLALIGCPAPASPLSPPSWIQGTWSDTGSGGIITWTFTGNDAIYTQGGITLDWGKLNGTSGTTVSDSSTSTTYTVSVTQGGVTINYTFVSTSPTTLTFQGGFTLTKM